MDNIVQIGKRIKDLRENTGKTQEAVSTALGMQRVKYAKIEAGLQDMKTADIIEICGYFKVSSDYLLGIAPVRSPDPEVKENNKFTGLSETALVKLHEMSEEERLVVSKMLENNDFYDMAYMIYRYTRAKSILPLVKRITALITYKYNENAHLLLINGTNKDDVTKLAMCLMIALSSLGRVTENFIDFYVTSKTTNGPIMFEKSVESVVSFMDINRFKVSQIYNKIVEAISDDLFNGEIADNFIEQYTDSITSNSNIDDDTKTLLLEAIEQIKERGE